jgi:hypothetical protein
MIGYALRQKPIYRFLSEKNLIASALLGTPSVQSVYDYYYPSALEDGGRLAPMAAELVD